MLKDRYVIEDQIDLSVSINADAWSFVKTAIEDITIKEEAGLYIDNLGKNKVKINYKTDILIKNERYIYLRVDTDGEILKNGGIDVLINGWSVPLKGTVIMPLQPPIQITLDLEVKADSAAKLNTIRLSFLEEYADVMPLCSSENDILVLTPSYPSNHNLYLSAFAHSRNKAYIQNGLKVQVASLSESNWYQTSYEFEKVPVITGGVALLKKLLLKKQYKIIIVHFVDVEYYQMFDGYISNEQLVFICHGPETTFEILSNVARPYFTAPVSEDAGKNPIKKQYVEKYSSKKNVHWIFVSEWLKQESERVLKIKFRNAYCIGNVIDENVFPYVEKKAEDRKKILVLRKFDNFAYHSVDIVVRAILALSRKDYFSKLEITIFGDGDYYEELIAPIKSFENVHFYRTFVKNSEIKKLHKENGIMFIPSRHDSQGVSMGEAASSGVVPIGSKVTCLSYFVNDKENRILAEPEDPYDLVRIYDRFYHNPEEYLEVSKNLSAYVQGICGKNQTINKEIHLLKTLYSQACESRKMLEKNDLTVIPVLTVAVLITEENIQYINRCIWSVLNHNNWEKCELLLIYDETKCDDFDVPEQYKISFGSVIRQICMANCNYGSMVLRGLQEAKGKYFKVINGNDWVDSENFAQLIDRLSEQEIDLCLMKGYYEPEKATGFLDGVQYDFLSEGIEYNYLDLLYPVYGLEPNGHMLETSVYQTRTLCKATYDLSSEKLCADMEFGVFSQQYIRTVVYYRLDVYRCMRKDDEGVDKNYWANHKKNLEKAIIKVLDFLEKNDEYPKPYKLYAYRHYIAGKIEMLIGILGQNNENDELNTFIKKLQEYPLTATISTENKWKEGEET